MSPRPPVMQGQDLASGNLTAPALYALAGAQGPELLALIESEFTAEGGLQRAIELVTAGNGITSARALARREADLVRPQPMPKLGTTITMPFCNNFFCAACDSFFLLSIPNYLQVLHPSPDCT